MADSANPTVPPPRLELTPTERAVLVLLAVAALLGYAWSASATGSPALTAEAALDFVIVHQGLLLLVMGLAVSAVIVWYAARAGKIRAANAEVRASQARAGDALDPHPSVAANLATGVRVAIAPALLPFSAPAILALVTAGGAGYAGVVPKTAFLNLNEIETPREPAADDRPLIVLLHGWNGKADGTWGQLPKLFRDDPRYARHATWTIGYPTFMARRTANIIELANFFVNQFDEREVFTHYSRVTIVAHSMGGLIAREMALLLARADRPPAFELIVEIAVPHAGVTRLTSLASALLIKEDLTRDMAENSSYLRGLTVRWSRAVPKQPTYCIYSPQDGVVPMASALYQCDEPYGSYLEGGHTDIVKPVDARDVRYTTPASRVR